MANKKNNQLEIKMNESPKVNLEDYVAISFFIVVMFVTLNFPTAFLLTMFFAVVYQLSKHFLEDNEDSKKVFSYIKKNFNSVFITAIILFFMDIVVTGFSVHYFRFASEGNKYVVMFWDKFGYPFGEIVRIVLVFIFVYYPLWIAGKSNNRFLVLLSFVSLCVGVIVFTSVVLGNLIIFFKGFC